MSYDLLFYLLLIVVAALYASVGHGGASGYLALMAVFAFSPDVMRPTALVLNLFVSLIAFWHFYRAGYFNWKLLWPFALASIPAAFIGGMITIDAGIYKIILAVLLLFAVGRLLFSFKDREEKPLRRQNLVLSLAIGAAIGLFSGIIGIGGGIILSPLILLLNWGRIKEAAAASALFIFLNSAAGLAGFSVDGIAFSPQMGLLIAAALAGAFIGAFLGAVKFNTLLLKRILAAVLVIASVKLMMPVG